MAGPGDRHRDGTGDPPGSRPRPGARDRPGPGDHVRRGGRRARDHLVGGGARRRRARGADAAALHPVGVLRVHGDRAGPLGPAHRPRRQAAPPDDPGRPAVPGLDGDLPRGLLGGRPAGPAVDRRRPGAAHRHGLVSPLLPAGDAAVLPAAAGVPVVCCGSRRRHQSMALLGASVAVAVAFTGWLHYAAMAPRARWRTCRCPRLAAAAADVLRCVAGGLASRCTWTRCWAGCARTGGPCWPRPSPARWRWSCLYAVLGRDRASGPTPPRTPCSRRCSCGRCCSRRGCSRRRPGGPTSGAPRARAPTAPPTCRCGVCSWCTRCSSWRLRIDRPARPPPPPAAVTAGVVTVLALAALAAGGRGSPADAGQPAAHRPPAPRPGGTADPYPTRLGPPSRHDGRPDVTLLGDRPVDARRPARPIRHRVRGRVLLLLCVLYAVSYVDRTAIVRGRPGAAPPTCT